MKTVVLGLMVALLLFASAGAHAFLGWPQFRQLLEAANVDAGAIAALAIGWYFGSACMLAFAGILFQQALRRINGLEIQTGPLWVISIMYFIFGSAAFVLRAFNPHFLLFVISGLLVGLFSFVGKDPGRHGDTA